MACASQVEKIGDNHWRVHLGNSIVNCLTETEARAIAAVPELYEQTLDEETTIDKAVLERTLKACRAYNLTSSAICRLERQLMR